VIVCVRNVQICAAYGGVVNGRGYCIGGMCMNVYTCVMGRVTYSGKFSSGPNFILCYLQLIRAFNFRSVHFTQENTPIITYLFMY